MNAEQIYNKLLSAGLTPAGACGVMGNMKAESGMNPKKVQLQTTTLSDDEYTRLVDSSEYGKYYDPVKRYESFGADSIGYGLFQLTYGGYKTEYFYYAKKLKVSIGDAAAQIDYVFQKVLPVEFKSLLNLLKNPNISVDECTRKFCEIFERPAVLNVSERQKYAREFYSQFSGKTIGSGIMTNIERVIATAEAEIGYLEKASNAYLDDKTANAGSGNWTKYARDLDNLGNFYNGKKNGYAWCDVFTDWCFVQTFGAAAARTMLCQPLNSAGAGCPYSANYYKQAGRWFSSPQAGDQIFFRSNGEITHTGLVVGVNSGTVTTIEGNTSGANGVIANGGGVCKKTYPIGSAYIYGYGRPKYDETDGTSTVSTSKSSATRPTHTYDLKVPLLKKGQAKNNGCLNLQAILNANGYDCGTPTGIFDAKTEARVKEIQKDLGLLADGEVGIKTWEKLFAI